MPSFVLSMLLACIVSTAPAGQGVATPPVVEVDSATDRVPTDARRETPPQDSVETPEEHPSEVEALADPSEEPAVIVPGEAAGEPPPSDPAVLPRDGSPVLLRGTACEMGSASDSLYPVAQALTTLRSGRFEITRCQILTDPLQGRVLEAGVRGQAQDLLLYVLGNLATDGYAVELAAAAPGELFLTVRTSPRGRQGTLRFVGVQQISVGGTFLRGDTPDRLTRITALHAGAFFPALVSNQLQTLGYRSTFVPERLGHVRVDLEPGRSIRRVRVHREAPLSAQDVQRQLSVSARPGALARGRCVSPRKLWRAPRPPICDAQDVACREWERGEIARLEQFLFDEGYMRGTASLGLSCGRAADEADLHVYLDKGRSHRIARRDTTVTGAPEADQRWLRREFMPRFLLVRRKRVTREFMDSRREAVETAYAEPSRARSLARASSEQKPHPDVHVATSYDEYAPGRPPPSRDIQLEIDVELGPAVEASFTRPTNARTTHPLSFTRAQLTDQLQIFARRELPSQATALRESANLRAFYQSRGYLFAQISGVHEDFGAVQKLRFQIDEGPQVRIKGLELRASESVPPAVLARVERHWQRERVLRWRGRASEVDILTDLGAVLAAYNENGYLCATGRVTLGFWPAALDTPGAHAQLTPAMLVEGRPDPAWLDQFDPTGLEALLHEDKLDVYMRFEVDPGPRVVTSRDESVRYLDEPIAANRRVLHAPASMSGRWGAYRILHGTPLRTPGSDDPGGLPVTTHTARDTAAAIVSQYRDGGFPVADAEVTWQLDAGGAEPTVELADIRDLTDPSQGICENAPPSRPVVVSPVVHVYEGRTGTFGDVLIRGNFKTRRAVLARELEFESGDTFRQRHVDRSLAHMRALGVSRVVDHHPYPVGCQLEDDDKCVVHEVITIQESEDYFANVQFGVGAMTLNPLYLFARPRVPNVLGTAWDLDTEAQWGVDLSDALAGTALCGNGEECYERSARASLLRSRFLGTAVDFDLTGQYRRRATPARGRIDSAIGNLRLSWKLGDNWSFYGGYLIQLANVSKDLVKPSVGSNGTTVINRGEAIVSDRTGLLETGANYTRVDNAFNPTKGFILTAEGKFAFAAPYVGGGDWWVRGDLTWQHFVPLPRTRDRLSIRYSIRYGHAVPIATLDTTSVPEVWRYFGGGTADLGIRGILPETMLVDTETIDLPFGGTLYRPRAQGGHIRLLGTVALQVVSIKDLLGGKLAHSLFYDSGFLTQRWHMVDPRRDYRHSIGVNAIKLDVELVTLALGYAVLVPTKNNVRPTDDPNGRVVFDVGITF